MQSNSLHLYDLELFLFLAVYFCENICFDHRRSNVWCFGVYQNKASLDHLDIEQFEEFAEFLKKQLHSIYL